MPNALFDIPMRRSREEDQALLKKSKKKATTTVRKGSGSLSDKIETIKAMVETHLGKYKDEYEVISDEERLHEYITKAINNGEISIDTETTGLDPLVDDLVGICLYTPDEKGVYVPVNHISYVTGKRAKNQLDIDIISHEIKRLEEAKTANIMFNAVFDIRFIQNHLNVKLQCAWDCYLAARLLNENEPSNALKKLHQKYILRGKEDAFKFDDLFKGVNFANVPIQTAYLYAAHDAVITYEYYEYQKKYLYYDPACTAEDRNGMNGVSWVFFNIEMPCISVVADMENNGVLFDMDYADELHEKYHKLLDERIEEFQTAYHMYDDEIAEYKGKVHLDDPINIGSSTQLSALLYDIIGLKGPVDKKTKEPSRSTAEEVLKQLDNPVVTAILKYRELSTIVSTFIDKLPNCVNKKDGRIHCKFNQYGADTGRMSSSDPNMQNIPSHNKDIRKMFIASEGYVLMSADYSQQEPKAMTMMCQDPKMIQAYKEGKDLYAEIAALSFNTTYDNCLEFRPDGTTNPEGKNRRSQAKSILLGVLYGRGVPSIAEQLGTTTKKAQAIKDSVFEGFPAIEKFEKDSLKMAEELGYVTTLWGRKRRLPVMMKPDYEFEWKDGSLPFGDPLDFDEELDDEVPEELIKKYVRKLKNTWAGKKRQIFEEANAEGIWIIDNTKAKIDTTRQIVNSRIQGSAADMTKLAMIKLGNDERLKELGFRLLIPVHDEIIAECPEENAKECVERFAKLMSEAPGEKFTIPISCDVEVTRAWYGERVEL